MARATGRLRGVILAVVLLLVFSGVPAVRAESLPAAPGPAERLVLTLGGQAAAAGQPFPVDILVTDANGVPAAPDRPVELRFDPPVNRAEAGAGARLQWVEPGTYATITMAPERTSLRLNLTVAQAGVARVGPAGAWNGEPRWFVAGPGPAVAVGFDRQVPLQVEAAAPVAAVRVQLYDAYGQPAREAGRRVRVRAVRDRKLDREVLLDAGQGEVAAVTGADGAAVLQVQVPGIILGRTWSLELTPEPGLALASGRNALALQVVDVLPTQLGLSLWVGQDRVASVSAGADVEVRVTAQVSSGTALSGRAGSLRLIMTEAQPDAVGGVRREELSGFSYQPADGGYYSLRLRLTRAGQYSFSAVDPGAAAPVVSPVRTLRVKPGEPASLGLAEAPGGSLQVAAGQPVPVTLRAVDAYGNPVERVRTQRVRLLGSTGLGVDRAVLGPDGLSVMVTRTAHFDLVADQPGRYDLALLGELSGQVRVEVVSPPSASPDASLTGADPAVGLRAAVRDLLAAGDGLAALSGADASALDQALSAVSQGVERELVRLKTRAGHATGAGLQQIRDQVTSQHLELTRAAERARLLEAQARGTPQLALRQKVRASLEAAAASVLAARNQLEP